MRRHHAPLTLLALALSALLAGCPAGGGSGDGGGGDKTGGTGQGGSGEGAVEEIHIGAVVALTGEVASFGAATDNGNNLAVEEVNAKQLLGPGKKLVLHTQDDQSTPTGAANAAKKLISENKVVALLGEVASKNSLAMAPIAQENKIPMISPSSTNPDVTKQEYVFRACYLDTFQGQMIARFGATLAEGSGMVAAILYDQTNAYSEGLKDAITVEWTAQGGTIAETQAYAAGDSDFRSLLVKIKSSKPNVVFLPGYATDTALIMNQAKQEGLLGPFVGGDGWDMPELLQKGGQAVEGSYFTTHYTETDPDPKVQAFVQAYEAKYGMKPDAIAALGYDSVMLLVDAIKRAGTTEGEALKNAIAATANFPGITGAITLNERGDPQKGMVIITIKGGQRVLAARLDPEGNAIMADTEVQPVQDGTATAQEMPTEAAPVDETTTTEDGVTHSEGDGHGH